MKALFIATLVSVYFVGGARAEHALEGEGTVAAATSGASESIAPMPEEAMNDVFRAIHAIAAGRSVDEKQLDRVRGYLRNWPAKWNLETVKRQISGIANRSLDPDVTRLSIERKLFGDGSQPRRRELEVPYSP